MARSDSDSADDGHEVLSEDDHHYDKTSTSTLTVITKKTETDWDDEWKRLAAREGQTVAFARVIVLIALLCATAAVTLGMRGYIRSDQREDFEMAFVAVADKILESFHYSVKRRLEAVDALSVAVTSHAKATRQPFPFVALPDYEIRAANTRVLGESYVIAYFPLVTEAIRGEWNNWTQSTDFTQAYQRAYEADVTMRLGQDKLFEPTGTDRAPIIPFDSSIVVDPLGQAEDGLYFPALQFSPVPPTILANVNFDAYNSPLAKGVNKATLQTGLATLGMADLEFNDATARAYLASAFALSQYRDRVEQVAFDPTSSLSYPVFSSFDMATRQVVGTMGVNINWRKIFTHVLPANIRGVHCVIDNTFNQTFTIQVDGAGATYLGVGDFHDPAYDHLVETASLNEYLKGTASKETRAYTSVDLDAKFGNFYLRVYPSAATENDFQNNDPRLFTIVIIGVFLFTSVVFAAYDYLVGRRQRTLMHQAIKSSAIVSSFFPSQVRGQLYQQNDKDATTRFVESASSERKHIANKFGHTTVMFADLAGFTKWSSSRPPEAVFVLLESLFRKFDAAAKRRGVFKVETIGDCYMAVTGLPEPQNMHAVICARFAASCIKYTRDVTSSLAGTLGADTADLQLRIGLHSGPVTAGVLRSDRARFQLFGDTVNKASRMESTGRPGCIHASEQTAQELRAKGKDRWLKSRKDHVTAKGLGELVTYWIEIPSSSPGSRLGSAAANAESSSHDFDEEFNLFQQDTMTAIDPGLGRKLQRLERRYLSEGSDMSSVQSEDDDSVVYC